MCVCVVMYVALFYKPLIGIDWLYVLARTFSCVCVSKYAYLIFCDNFAFSQNQLKLMVTFFLSIFPFILFIVLLLFKHKILDSVCRKNAQKFQRL